MEMQGGRHLAISTQQAWDALNDPQVLQACVPGCDRFEAAGDNRYAVGVAVRVGPVGAKFSGTITLSEVVPPTSYTIAFEGNGGAAGFGRGQAKVQLTPAAADGGGCELAYTAQAQVGGKIAQVGQRLVDGVARAMADDFFQRFDAQMQQRHPQASAAQPPAAPVATGMRVPAWVWIGGAIVIVAAIWLVRRHG